MSFLPFTLHIESSPLHLQLGKSRLVTQFEMPNFSIITNRITNSAKDRYLISVVDKEDIKRSRIPDIIGYQFIWIQIISNCDFPPNDCTFSVLLSKCVGHRPIFIWCMKIIPETMRKFTTFNTVVALDYKRKNVL